MALCLVALVAAPGCGGRMRRLAADPGPAAKIRPIEPRIDAVLGKTLVVPVSLEGAVNPSRAVVVRLDDGRRLTPGLYWISVRPMNGEPAWGWLPPAGYWTATPATANSRPSPTGSWVLAIDLPFTSVGQGLWIDSERYPLNWLPDPSVVRATDGVGPWRPPLGDAVPQRMLEFAGAETRSPFRRWRYLLLTKGLMPPPRDMDEPRSGPRFDDSVLESLARLTEARWRVAIALLWAADSDLAERVKRRLAGAVDFGNGAVAPAWPTGNLELSSLLFDLLAPRIDGQGRADRAKAWLDTLPPAAAWVADDAGLRDAATGRAVATLGVANLTERATLAWATPRGEQNPPDLTTLPPTEARPLAVVAPPPGEGAKNPGTTPIMVHAGRWTALRGVGVERLSVSPPGLKIPTLLGDWTMNGFLAGEPDPPMAGEEGRAAAGLLYRAADGSNAWLLYVECRKPEADTALETIRVWLGPFGSASAVLRLSSDGAFASEQPGQRPEPEQGPQMVSAEPGKWIARIPIPPRCIEADGTLRIAVERTDSQGRRSVWPRPMLPWQVEPGRIAVDLSAWGDVPTATPASTTR